MTRSKIIALEFNASYQTAYFFFNIVEVFQQVIHNIHVDYITLGYDLLLHKIRNGE